jgi:hypothetical protein
MPRVTKRKTLPELSVGAPADVPAPPETPPPPTPPSEPPPEQVEPPKPRIPDLSARSAALSVWQPNPTATSRSVAEIERNASQALNQRLKPAQRDDQIEVRCDAADRCVYRGNALDATIRPDGTVEYREKSLASSRNYGVAPPPNTPTRLEDLQAPQQLQFSARLQLPAVEAERQRFLDQTEGLRRERTQAWNEKIEADGQVSFRARLEDVWKDRTQSAEVRRRELFRLWEETSPDELGARYRRLVLDYIRRNLAEDSRDAYSAPELTALNARRQQREPFVPYGSR